MLDERMNYIINSITTAGGEAEMMGKRQKKTHLDMQENFSNNPPG